MALVFLGWNNQSFHSDVIQVQVKDEMIRSNLCALANLVEQGVRQKLMDDRNNISGTSINKSKYFHSFDISTELI